MIELTINNKKVGTEKGNTILQVALSNGIKIPHLCYDKRILPYGGCRLCIVEIEGQRKLEASCATLATEGMVVQTETSRVRKIRRNVLEFILVHHPLDCPVCDKAGVCDLQDLAFEYGGTEGRFVRQRRNAPPDLRSPFVELNANRCILCGKCVRLCAEHQGKSAMGFIGRGFPTAVQPAFGDKLECDYCGQCIDVCPTGAILSRPFKFKSRQWSLEEKDTICPFCSCGCTLTLGIADGKILRSRGREDSGVSEGDLCGRGRFGVDFIYGGNRLTSPMIRKDGDLVPVSWEEALNFISNSLKSIISSYGPSSIGALGSPRCTNEDNYLLQKFMREAVGSGNIDSASAFGYGLAEKAWNKAFCRQGHKINLKSPLGKDAIFVLESDLSITHPVLGLNILKAKRQGAKLIVADSKETKLTKHSSQWAGIKQGTGVALLNGMMRIMIDKGLVDEQAVSKISGYQELKETLKDYGTERVSEITGIAEEEIVSAAETFANAGTRMLTLSISVSENTKGLDTVLAAANLINLLGDSPDALQIPAEYANTFGSYQMGIRPDAGDSGKGMAEMLYEPYSLRALYIMGADPVSAFPDMSKIVAALKSFELLIVQDISLTETAKLADVVLPASSWAEKDGTYTSTEGVMQKVVKAVEPVGQALPDWQIINRLAQAMGKDMGIKDLETVSNEIALLSYVQPSAFCPLPHFNPVHYTPGEEPDKEYPLSMAVRDILQHAGSSSTRSKALSLVSSEALLEINEQDAERLGISNNGHVKVTSRRGTAYLKTIVSDNVPGGVVYVPAHFPHSGVSGLMRAAGNGESSVAAVRVDTM